MNGIWRRSRSIGGNVPAEAIRSIGVTQLTYYRWRKEFGTLATIEMPARIAGPIGVGEAGLVQVPLESGQVFGVDFR